SFVSVYIHFIFFFFFFSSRRRHTRFSRDWSSDVCSSDLSSIGKGGEIIISTMEHHSNIVPWQMLCETNGCTLKIIPVTDEGELEIGRASCRERGERWAVDVA